MQIPDLKTRQALMEYLSPFISDNKKNLMTKILNDRTRHLTVVLENVAKPHNASAAIRTCECFGIQDVHVVEKDEFFRPNTDVVQGSTKWLNLIRHSNKDPFNLKNCIAGLKEKGYQIAATTLRGDSVSIREIDLNQKIALCFGAENLGLSDEVHEMADCHVHVPMQGFTQSLNLSVSVALCLYDLTVRLRSSDIKWQLSAEEKKLLKYVWYVKTAQNGHRLVEDYLKKKS